MSKRLSDRGMEVVASTPDQFAKVIRDDYERFGAIVRNANMKID